MKTILDSLENIIEECNEMKKILSPNELVKELFGEEVKESSLGQIEADVSIEEINEAFEEARQTDEDALLPDDEIGYDAQKEEGNIKEEEK